MARESYREPSGQHERAETAEWDDTPTRRKHASSAAEWDGASTIMSMAARFGVLQGLMGSFQRLALPVGRATLYDVLVACSFGFVYERYC